MTHMNKEKKLNINKHEHNIRQLIFVSISFIIFSILYGIFLPDDWENSFGAFSKPISWAASSIPSIVNISTHSPMPHIINGYLGLLFWTVILFVIFSITNGLCTRLSNEIAWRLKNNRMPLFSPIIIIIIFLSTLYIFYGMIEVDLKKLATSSSLRLFSEKMATNRISLIFNGAILFYVVGPAKFID